MSEEAAMMRRLLDGFPELTPLLENHLAEFDDEVLPYLLLADIARWAQTSLAALPYEVGRLVAWLEDEFVHAEPRVKDLIGLGFVEAIPLTPEGASVLCRLGPELTIVATDLGLLPHRGES